MTTNLPYVVIVGGGAGGLELAAMLARKGRVDITLVDARPTHLWKPLLHEVAAGTLNPQEDEVNYLAFASANNFRFCLGTLAGLDRNKKEIILAPLLDKRHQVTISQRRISYDVLVIAVGSIANDFGTPGAREHCLFLDNRADADDFQQNILNHLIALPYQQKKYFNIAVVGGGATGIELIAELHNAIRLMTRYGLHIDPQTVTFTLIEAAARLLPALNERLSRLVLKELKRLNIEVALADPVKEVTAAGLTTQSGKFIPADIKVWTAGIKAPDFLRQLDGLEVNRNNQLLVQQTLQTTKDPAIFAIGDCASCPQKGTDKPVPPRAQAAHQQAQHLVKALTLYFKHKPLPAYIYRDYGSLITVSHYKIVGNLMGKIAKNVFIEGKLARFFYLSLYKQHQAVLYGYWRVAMLTTANFISHRVKPRLKLH